MLSIKEKRGIFFALSNAECTKIFITLFTITIELTGFYWFLSRHINDILLLTICHIRYEFFCIYRISFLPFVGVDKFSFLKAFTLGSTHTLFMFFFFLFYFLLLSKINLVSCKPPQVLPLQPVTQTTRELCHCNPVNPRAPPLWATQISPYQPKSTNISFDLSSPTLIRAPSRH